MQIKFSEFGGKGKALWEQIKGELAEAGIDLENGEIDLGGDKSGVKVVCVAPDLKDSVEEMGKSQRDQVVMVRVDSETSRRLDAWVESGAVKSRSEAAALFIREGLKIRSSELEQLEDALRQVEEAKSRLRDQARQVFGAATADTVDTVDTVDPVETVDPVDPADTDAL